jgi:CRP-like cAMP-binding protein
MEDLADFLGSQPPFDTVGADDVARVAAVTEIESYPAGKTIFSQGAGPVEYLWVVRTGSVEIVHNGRVLDLLGPGELFGRASMLSGLPTGFEARGRGHAMLPHTRRDHAGLSWHARTSCGSSPGRVPVTVLGTRVSARRRSIRFSAASRR